MLRPAPLSSLTLATALVLALAGSTPALRGAQAPLAPDGSATPATSAPIPTVEEIFGKPPLTGERPADAAVSADGSWCVFRLPFAGAVPAPDSAAGPATRPSSGRTGRWILARTDGTLQKNLEFQGRRPTVFRFAPSGRELWFVDGKRILGADVDRPLEAARELVAAKQELDSVTFHDAGRILYRTEAGWFLMAPDDGDKEGRLVTTRRDATQFGWCETGAFAVFLAPEAAAGPQTTSRPRAASRRGSRTSRRQIVVSEVGTKSETLVGAAEVDQRAHLSPDGRFVVFSSTTPEPGQTQMIPDYLTSRVSTRPARESMASDLTPVRAVRWADLGHGTELMELEIPGDERRHVRGIEFARSGSRLLVQVDSACFHERWLLAYDLPDQKPRILWHERDEAWIGAHTALFDTTGENVLFVSDRSGYLHLYTVPFAGGEPKDLTRGEYEVLSVQRVGRGRDLLLTTSEGSSSERRLLLLREDGADRRVVPAGAGFPSSPVASADGSTVVFMHADLFVPGDLWSVRVGGDSGAMRLTDTVPAGFKERRWRLPQEVRVRSDDGTLVAAHVHRPVGERPARGWPAVIFLHGAGYLQNVMRSMTSYEVNLLFHQRLADRGYVVMNPDFRGSSGYGRKFRTDVHKDLGGPEREDVKACKRWLVENEGVDGERVGIYGGSYGGFLALMLLFKDPGEFACGAALRPVTDWATYHPGYTQPRLGNLKDEPEVYKKTSPIHFAEGLEKPVLILHGMMDSNVFVQDSVRLIERLIKLGKDFDAMLYPSQDHAFTDPASWIDEYRRIERFFDEHLKGPR